MENQNKNSIDIDLVIICIKIDSILNRVLNQAIDCLRSEGIRSHVKILYSYNKDSFASRFEYIKVRKRNPAHSRNEAIKYCQNKYIVFLDDDTLVNKLWALEIKKSIALNYVDACFFNSIDDQSIFNSAAADHGLILKADTAGCLIKREVFSLGLKFDEQFYRAEDCEFATKLLRLKFMIKYSSVFLDNLKTLNRFNFIIIKRIMNRYYLELLKAKYLDLNFTFSQAKGHRITYILNYFFKKIVKMEALKINTFRYQLFSKEYSLTKGTNFYLSDENLILRDDGVIVEKIKKYKIIQKNKMRFIEIL